MLTTHYMEEAETLCDRVAIMESGRIVAVDTPAGLIARFGGGYAVTCAFGAEVDAVALAALPGVSAVSGPDDPQRAERRHLRPAHRRGGAHHARALALAERSGVSPLRPARPPPRAGRRLPGPHRAHPARLIGCDCSLVARPSVSRASKASRIEGPRDVARRPPLVVLTATQTRLLLLDRASLVSNLTLAIASMVVFGLLIGGDRATAAGLCRRRGRLTRGGAGGRRLPRQRPGQRGPVRPRSGRAQLQEVRIAPWCSSPAGFGADLASGQARAEVAFDASDARGGLSSQRRGHGDGGGVNGALSGTPQAVAVASSGVQHRPQRQIDWLTPGMVGLTVMLVNLVVGATVILWRDRGCSSASP